MLVTRFKIMMAAVALMMVVGGFASLGEGMKYPSAKTITYAQFIKQGPVEGWFDVTGGYLDISGAILPGKQAKSYLVPFRAVGEPSSAPVNALVEIRDDSLVAQIDRYNNSVGKDTTPYGMSHDAQTGPIPPAAMTMDISGMVRNYGVSDNSAGSSSMDTAGTLTIHKDKHPSIILGIGSIIAGLLLCIVSLATFGIHIDMHSLMSGGRAKQAQPRLDPQPVYGQQPYGQPTYAAPPQNYQPYPQQPSASQNYQAYPPPPPMPSSAVAATVVAVVAEPPPTPLPVEPEVPPAKSKEQMEMDKLREMKPFDPFAD